MITIIVLLTVLWFVPGLLGSYLSLEFGWRRGPYPLDVDIGDLILGCFLALFGIMNLICGLVFFFGWVLRNTVNTKRVVFRRKT